MNKFFLTAATLAFVASTAGATVKPSPTPTPTPSPAAITNDINNDVKINYDLDLSNDVYVDNKNYNHLANDAYADSDSKSYSDSKAYATGGHAYADGGDARVGDIRVGGSGASTATTGPVTSTNRTSSNAQSGGNVIDASDRSVNSTRLTFIPTVTQITPPSTLGVGNVIKETLACGPLQKVQRVPVDGKFFKVFGTKDVPQGWTDDLVPYTNERGELQMYMEHTLPDGSIRLFGHQPILFTTIVGVSGNKSFQIGGGSGGDWGQSGAGSSSSNQRMITNIQLRYCEVGIMKPVVETEVVFVEKATIRE